MAELARDGFLHDELVAALDRPKPKQSSEYAFPRHRRPYQHQLECWRWLLDDGTPRSVLVSSGTGSGKTECFLVPILEDLVRQRSLNGHLSGVQALFLYPLNALINSQRDRLRAWCGGFGQDVRFCLYNGETPEHAKAADANQAGAEQISRQQLRADPPPVLVTNATMLEYMLVRTEDAPVVERSQGQLRWIVLDEAHTYIGSHAAEMTLLLRRVLHRFGVAPAGRAVCRHLSDDWGRRRKAGLEALLGGFVWCAYRASACGHWRAICAATASCDWSAAVDLDNAKHGAGRALRGSVQPP